MRFFVLFVNYFATHLLVLTLSFLCIAIFVFFTILLSSNAKLSISISISKWNRSLLNGIQPNIITPTFLRFNNTEILDFVLYEQSDRIKQFSIYLSGRRLSWDWSDIYCFFVNSNESTHGIIDRRSSEPFVLCPLPSVEQRMVLNSSSRLRMSLRIYDKKSPNHVLSSPIITVPIYHRNQYNVSIYTMIHDKTEVLIEWIEYHRLIGVEHFYLYDHFSTDNLDNFLRSYLEKQLVTIIRWPYKSLESHYWNMMQSASMNHALKSFGPFNRWMGYFDVDEYFQIIDRSKLVNNTISLADFLDQNFPESSYPGGVQFRNCPISCLVDQDDIVASRYRILFEKCRHISYRRDCQTRTKLFIRPRNVPIMQNIHALQYGVIFAPSSNSSPLAEFRHYHYGVMLTNLVQNEMVDTSMDIYINELKKRIITY